jgi:hypothetical protein
MKSEKTISSSTFWGELTRLKSSIIIKPIKSQMKRLL